MWAANHSEYETDSIAPAPEFRPPPPPPPVPTAGGVGGVGGSVLIPRHQLVAMQKYYAVVKDAFFAFGQTDGDADRVVRRLFDLTPEVLGASGGTATAAAPPPIATALARRGWQAAGCLLALAEARNPRALRHRTPAGEDALTLALVAAADADADDVGEAEEAEEAVLRRLVRQLASADGGGFGSDGRGRNALHAAAAAAAGRPRLLTVVLEELDSQLQLLPELRDRLTAALNARDAAGCSPVHRMAEGNLAEGARTLAGMAERHRLRVEWAAPQAGGRGLSPLAMAAEAGALEVCELLLGGGLDSLDPIRRAGQRAMWLRAAPTGPARRLLGRRCRRLLEPLADVPEAARRRLQDGLRERRLEEKFLAGLGDLLCLPCGPRLPASMATELERLDQRSGVARLAAWDVLQRLGEPQLARMLEESAEGDEEEPRRPDQAEP